MASKMDDLNKSLLQQLECPVCLETCTPPIRMCIRSHIICSQCATGLTVCAICRQPMAAERSYFAENLCAKVKFPCKHASNGCHGIFDLSQLNAHLSDCSYKNYDCLFGGKYVDGVWQNGCEWKGPEFQLFEHFEKTHEKTKCFQNPRLALTINKEPEFSHTGVPSVRLISAHGSLFWLIICYWFPSKEIEFIIVYICSKELSSKYAYKVEVGEIPGSQLSFYSSIVACNLKASENKTLKVTNEIRNVFNIPDGRLPFKLTILENK